MPIRLPMLVLLSLLIMMLMMMTTLMILMMLTKKLVMLTFVFSGATGEWNRHEPPSSNNDAAQAQEELARGPQSGARTRSAAIDKEDEGKSSTKARRARREEDAPEHPRRKSAGIKHMVTLTAKAKTRPKPKTPCAKGAYAETAIDKRRKPAIGISADKTPPPAGRGLTEVLPGARVMRRRMNHLRFPPDKP